jgi:hypothetical protein
MYANVLQDRQQHPMGVIPGNDRALQRSLDHENQLSNRTGSIMMQKVQEHLGFFYFLDSDYVGG